MDRAEAIHVLDLDLGAELGGACLPDRDVGVAAEAALLQVAVVDADPDQHLAEPLHVLAGLVGGAHVGLGDDLHQRHPGAVEVDQRLARGVDVAAVGQLAGVLLEVDAGDPHPHRAVADLDVNAAVA